MWFNQKPMRTMIRASVRTLRHKSSCQREGRGPLRMAPGSRKAELRDARNRACRHCVSHRTRLGQSQDSPGLFSHRPQCIPCLLKQLGLALSSLIRESGLSGADRVEAPCLQLCLTKINWEGGDKSCLYCQQSPSPILHVGAETKGTHLSFPYLCRNRGLSEMLEPSNLTPSYLIRAGTKETKTVRFSQLVFQISTLYLLPPKTSISPSSKGKQKKHKGNITEKGKGNITEQVLLLLIYVQVAWQPALTWSLQWTSRGMDVRPPGHTACPVYGPLTRGQGWVHAVLQSWQKTASRAPAVFRSSPIRFLSLPHWPKFL